MELPHFHFVADIRTQSWRFDTELSSSFLSYLCYVTMKRFSP